MQRTKSAALNSSITMVTQFLSLIIRFITQTIFIHYLGKYYLGVNGLFSDILSVINFSELGIGTAITAALYSPIANGDISQIKALMSLYRKVYLIITAVVGILGIAIAPTVYLFIKNSPFGYFSITTWFLLFSVSSALSYLSANKRSFLMASQLSYVSTLNDFVFKLAQQMLQIIILITWQNFTGYLVIQLAMTLLSNWQLNKMVQQKFPNVFDDIRSAASISKDLVKQIKKNVFGAISSKFGSIVVFGTDNLLLSMFIGLKEVGMYSNYALIINSLNAVFSQAIGSIVGSIGNLNVKEGIEQKKKVLNQLLFINSWINFVLVSSLAIGINSFITLWAGKAFAFSNIIIVVILFNFSLTQLRYAPTNFISGFGLYWTLRWKSLIEAAINLVASLLLVTWGNLGVLGVVLGTFISNLLVNFWWEPFIVFKYGFKSVKGYITFQMRDGLYLGISFLGIIFGVWTASDININSIGVWIFLEMGAGFVSFVFYGLIFFLTPEFKDLVSRLRSIIYRH